MTQPRGPGRPFQKGKSGNPGGRCKAIKEVQDIAREHTALAMKTLASIAGNAKLAASARVTAAVALLERGWGKPSQEVLVKTSPLDGLEPNELLAVHAALTSLADSEGGTRH